MALGRRAVALLLGIAMVAGGIVVACDSFTGGSTSLGAETADATAPTDQASPLEDAPAAALESGVDAGGCAYAAVVLTDKPLAYWHMEPDGVILRDVTGHQHDLTMAGGGATVVDGAISSCPSENRATRFDGLNTYAFASDATSRKLDFASLEKFTIELWALRDTPDSGPTAATSFAHLLGLKDGNLPKSGYLLYYNKTTTSLDFEYDWIKNNDAGTRNVKTNISPTERFAYYAIIFDGDQLALAVDGNIVNTNPGPFQGMGARGSEFVLGRELSTNNHFFAGVLDEVAIYDRALTPIEVNKHFAAASK